MSHHLPSYLHTLRKERGLSQPELAALLNVTASALSRFEKLSRRPTAELMVATEVIFGCRPKDVFPGFYRTVERTIVERAIAEHQRLEATAGPAIAEKLRFLTSITERASQTTLGI